MKSLSTICTFILVPYFSFSQITFNKSYQIGSESSLSSVCITSNGDYAACGYSDNNLLIIRTDAQGNLLWSKTYPGSGLCIKPTRDNGFIICGTVNGNGLLMKTNQAGNQIWTKTFNITKSWNCVIETVDNFFVVCGSLTDVQGSHLEIAKFDQNGSEIWNHYYPPYTTWAVGNSLIEISENGLVLYPVCGNVGDEGSLNGGIYLLIVRWDGNVYYQETFYEGVGYGGVEAQGLCIQQRNDQSLVFCGYGVPNGQGVVGDERGLIYNTTWLGTFQWKYQFPWDNPYSINAIRNTEDNGFICLADYGVNYGLIKLDSLRVVQWSKNYNNAFLYDFQRTNDRGNILCGRYNGGVLWQAFLMKTDETGNGENNAVYNLPNQSKLNILPNPSSGKFSFQVPVDAVEIFILNIEGKSIYEEKIENSINKTHCIDISNQPKDLYFLKVVRTMSVSTQKIVIY
jgi:hypothetical protein